KQLEEEGLMQVFFVAAGRREPIVGVVGALQLDVIVSRLKTEYGVQVQIEPASYSAARWVEDAAQVARLLPSLGGQITLASDRHGRHALLFGSEWELQYFQRKYPEVPLLFESPSDPSSR